MGLNMKQFIAKKDLIFLANTSNMSNKVVKRSEAEKAFKQGKEVWRLQKGYGQYLYVVGSQKQTLQAILDYFNIPKLPEHWYLEKVTQEMLDRYYDPRVE